MLNWCIFVSYEPTEAQDATTSNGSTGDHTASHSDSTMATAVSAAAGPDLPVAGAAGGAARPGRTAGQTE